jgi:hypothetical protein
MIHKILILIFICTFLYSNEEPTTNIKNAEDLKKQLKKEISNKQKAYLEDKKRLEKENKELEEQGFCSCNNN